MKRAPQAEAIMNNIIIVVVMYSRESLVNLVSLIHQTKTIQISSYNTNPLTGLYIHLPNFSTKCLKTDNSPPNILLINLPVMC